MVPAIYPGDKTFSERAKFGRGREPSNPSFKAATDWLIFPPSWILFREDFSHMHNTDGSRC